MSAFDPVITLRQTVDFIKEAQALIRGITFDQLVADPIRLRAFERVMELVGESVKRVPQKSSRQSFGNTLEKFREMSFAEKWSVAWGLWKTALEARVRAMRRMHPDLSDQECRQLAP